MDRIYAQGLLLSNLLHRLTHQKHKEDVPLPFSHIVLDEVHERSVESDLLCFILREKLMGYMNHPKERVAPPKLVLMSATLQTGLFAEYFSSVYNNGRQSKPRGKNVSLPSRVPSLEVGARCPYNVYEVYLEELRDFCPPLAADLDISVSTWPSQPRRLHP